MKKITILLLGFIYSAFCLAQAEKKASYRFDKMDVDYKKDYYNANFVLEYVYTDGNSLADRYTQSITVTDSLVTLKFVAPDFASFNDADYEKQFILDPEELDSLKSMVKKANLKQLKPGIAHWRGPIYTREVLIIKYDSIQIAGGQTYRSFASYSETDPLDLVEREVEKDKRASSSISGDYDSIINLLKKYFKKAEDPHKYASKH